MHGLFVGGSIALSIVSLLVASFVAWTVFARSVGAAKTRILVLLYAERRAVLGLDMLAAACNSRRVLREAVEQLFVEGCVIWPERHPSLLMRRFKITDFGIECLNEQMAAAVKSARRRS